MSDIFGEVEDNEFWETMGQEPAPQESEAEAAPTVDEGTPAQEEEADAQPGRPRNPDGTFAPKAQDADAPTTEAEADDVAAKIALLEKRLQDKDEFNGRLSNELGQLRQQLAEYEQTVQQQQPPVMDWESLVQENPAAAAEALFERRGRNGFSQQDAAALEYVLRSWDEVAPGAAKLWVENKQMMERLEELDQRTRSVTAQQEDRQVASELRRLREEYPAVFDNPEAVTADLPPAVAALMHNTLATGTVEEKIGVIQTLARLSGGRQDADTLKQTADEIARDAYLSQDRAIREAAVASAATAKSEQPTSLADRIGAEWDELESHKSGWNIS